MANYSNLLSEKNTVLGMRLHGYLYLLGAMFFLFSCTSEFYNPVEPVPDAGELTLAYKVDNDMPLTRTVAAMGHETMLKRVHLLFFDTTEEDVFTAFKTVAVSPGRSTFSIDPPENLVIGRPYRVLAVGNADNFNSDGLSLSEWLTHFVGGYNELIGKLKLGHEGPFTRENPGLLPLYGKFINRSGEESTFTVIQDGDSKKVIESESSTFFFSRAVCRFDIHNLVGHLLDIRAARVVNSPESGYLFTDGLIGGKIPEYSPEEAPDGSGYMPITTDVAEGENTTQRLEGSLYGFPNIVNTTVVNDFVTSALMIAGYYIDPETGEKDNELTYYRFNMANLGDSQVLNRNYCYRATIKGVRRRGAYTEKEAYNDSSPIFIYEFNPAWGTDDDNVVTDDEGNFLIVNKTHLTFQGDASDADFVELHVSTNPELEWDVEWVAEPGHSNDKFSFEKISDSAIKCGPKEMNPEPFLRYGYINVVATNHTTGKILKLPVYLVQMSVMQNVKCLTVNGSTGTITQYLDPMGGSVSLDVVTGAKLNNWEVKDDGGYFMSWDSQGLGFTKGGGNNGVLEIKAPANISGKTRTATLIVSLVENAFNDDGEKRVRDVIINLVQETSSQLLEVYNAPDNENKVLDIECLDLKNFDNPNGVVNPRNFIVKLTDPTNLRYRVWTDFDKDRDAVLSVTYHRGPGTAHPDGEAKSSHPENANGTAKINKNDKYEGLTNGTQFWLNPFRTGPDDPRITGTVHVEAYSIKNSSIRQEIAFTVRLNSQEVEIGDCVLQNSDGTYFLWPDRNAGATSLIQNGKEIKASYSDSRKNVYITRPSGAQPWEISGFEGVEYTTKFTWGVSAGKVSNISGNSNSNIIKAKQVWIEDNPFYKTYYGTGENEIDKWGGLTKVQIETLCGRTIVSKSRPFTVSTVSHGTIPVCNWIHQNLFGCNYGTSDISSASSTIANCPVLVFDGEKLYLNTIKRNVSPANYTVSGTRVRLVRSMTISEINRYKTYYLGRK